MKIHCVEGLFSFYTRPLTKAVKSLNLNVEVVTYPWTVKKITLGTGDILCGHSFGGGKALHLWNNSYPLASFNYLFLLDPRKGPLGFPDPKFVDYNMTGRSYNYFQTGPIRGYEVRGVAWNTLVKGYWHGRMPRNPAFLFKLMEVVKSAN